MKKLLFILLFIVTGYLYGQNPAALTVEKIMRDPKWMGVSPTNIQWDENSRKVYFNWNPEIASKDGFYQITMQNRTPQKVSDEVVKGLEKGQSTIPVTALKFYLNETAIFSYII